MYIEEIDEDKTPEVPKPTVDQSSTKRKDDKDAGTGGVVSKREEDMDCNVGGSNTRRPPALVVDDDAATRELRDLGVNAMIVGISDDRDHTMEEFIQAGMDQFYEKPIKAETVISILRAL
ncbi:hypothetical protein POM88_049857 [Heracleum sosnowskyi]|uniref:Response regulatory domain-containing protein n=1 Tax=Heracleum sosnowskyi TaxID=360622 RepID=A0AAD8GXP5_9APIA|nr:hypothetical protein POM88_049857 [Heracleum sosnowskyi]